MNNRVTNVYTNLDNGNTVTEVGNFVDKDLRVTDNGDGTLTILVLSTGNIAVYGPDGKALARNPGQIRFELLIDHGGTPRDPSDNVSLEFLGEVKGSTGQTTTSALRSSRYLSADQRTGTVHRSTLALRSV